MTILQSRIQLTFRLIAAALCVSSSIWATPAAAQRLHVQAQTSGTPIAAATINFRCLDGDCRDSSLTILTGPLGYVNIPFNSRQEVRVSCVGFVAQIDTLTGTEDYRLLLEATDYTSDEVVVTAQYLPTKQSESLYNVEIIPAAQMKAQGANTLSQLLKQRAGMRLSQDNLLGSSLSIQGIGGRNVKIMIDGVPVTGRTNGNVDLSQINLNNAERVEIVDDPLSVHYGTDALGGVINIITRGASDNQWNAELNSYYESVGHYNGDGNISFNSGDISLALAGGRNFFDGFAVPDTGRFQQWKPKEQYFGDFNAIWKLDQTKLRTSTRYFNEFIWNRGEPRAPYRETAFDDEYCTMRFSNSLFVLHSFTSRKALDLTLAQSYYRRRKNSFFKDLTTGISQLTTDPGDQDTSIFNSLLLRASFNDDGSSDVIDYQLGLDFNLEDVEGGRINDGIQSIDDYAAFGSMRIKALEGLQVQPGLRYAYNTRFDAPLLPSLNARFNVKDNLVLRASWAEGFRAPSLRELYFFFVDINHNIRGNTELDAERSTHYKLDMQWTLDSQQNAVKLEPGVFYNSIRNLISLAQVNSELFSYVNIGRFRTLGVELDLHYNRSNAAATISFSYLGRSNSLADNSSVSTEVSEYSFSPELSANLMYSLTERLDVNLFYKFTGALPQFNLSEDGTISEGRIADYSILDMSVVARFFDDNMSLTTGLKNIFDVVNISNSIASGEAHSAGSGSVSVGTGRSAFVTLQVIAPFQ